MDESWGENLIKNLPFWGVEKVWIWGVEFWSKFYHFGGRKKGWFWGWILTAILGLLGLKSDWFGGYIFDKKWMNFDGKCKVWVYNSNPVDV